MKDSTAEEYINLFPFLAATKLGTSTSGQQELVDIAAEQAELDQEFDPLDAENNQADRFITCVKFAMPMFSVRDLTEMLSYRCVSSLNKNNKKLSALVMSNIDTFKY